MTVLTLAIVIAIRIAIARLLLHRPPWIFTENAFGALADDQRDLMKSILETELDQSAIISIGRRTQSDDLCRKIIHLTSGPIA